MTAVPVHVAMYMQDTCKGLQKSVSYIISPPKMDKNFLLFFVQTTVLLIAWSYTLKVPVMWKHYFLKIQPRLSTIMNLVGSEGVHKLGNCII